MAVPSSGQLRLYADIGVELSVPSTNVSLGSMSDQAGFAAPDAMSDFYGYSSIFPPAAAQTRVVAANSTSVVRVCACIQGADPNVPTEFGAYIGTCANNYACNTKYICSTPNNVFTSRCYYVTATGLSGSTTYYGWAYGCNDAGIAVGARGQATTFLSLSYQAGRMNFQAENYGVYRKAYYEPATSSYRDYLSCTFTQFESNIQTYSTLTEAYMCSVTNAKNRICAGDISNNAGERAGIAAVQYCGNILANPTTYIRCGCYGFFGNNCSVAYVTSRCCGPNFFQGVLNTLCGEGVVEGLYMCYCYIP